MRWIALALLLAAVYAGAAQAQTPTPLPVGKPPREGVAATVDLLPATAVNTTGTSLDVRYFATASLQFTATGTCTAYSIIIETTASNAGPVTWALDRTITQAEVAGGASKFFPLTLPTGWARARATPGASCTVGVKLVGLR